MKTMESPGKDQGLASSEGSSSHIQKILKSTEKQESEKQESEKRIKMWQEVVEVLETNAKSKKCNPVEAGLCKFKAQKLDSGILYGGCIFPKKLPEKPPTVPIGFDFEMEKRIKQREEAERVLEDKHFNAKPCPYPILLGVVGVPNKKEIPLTIPRTPAFVQKKRTPKPTQEGEDEEQPMVIRAQQLPHYGVPFKPKIPVRRTVEICPFSFDSKSHLQKEKKIKQVQKGEVPKF
ncbi:hypothetical protein E5288_WYG006579 [Bos mutus]|uniref:TPX2 central domain-containing protein n=1 Tax=Bos mutus TaxID=72004 RepID=A0A6B0R8L3_9CETA|nr:hypothetical protein [Bos mutus]